MTDILTLRVVLDGSNPEIWRTLELYSDLPLIEVGHAIQIAVGWENVHRQCFHNHAPDEPALKGDEICWLDADLMDEPLHRDLALSTLESALAASGGVLYFEYDFGDRWIHRVSLMHRRPADGQAPRMILLEGELRAPIEDSGGLSTWYEYLRIISAKDEARNYQEVLDWMRWRVGPCGNIDPTHFDIDVARRKLALHAAGYRGKSVLGTWLQQVPTGTERFFGKMIAQTELTLDPQFAKPSWLEQILEPFAELIRLCAGTGVKLTHAGWLPPRVIEELLERCQWHGIDYESGTTKRENNLDTVRWLRDIAEEFKLVRKYRGHLIATEFGLELLAEPGTLHRYLLDCLISGMNSKIHRDCQITLWIVDEMGLEGFEERADTSNAMLGALHYADARTGEPLTRDSYAPTSALWHLIDRITNFHFSLPTEPNLPARRAALSQLRCYLLSGFEHSLVLEGN
ncbi:plasmid pRiA4b ORF-3 family protein [Glutamicibacter endophyticus]|uniref:plasmid pRiA4b ORF-3 family protein n=1 Tax=Glutamicibacter endophyticus TaxID=1522174 RepID=UPI003AF0208D